jgi:hypothetical protein
MQTILPLIQNNPYALNIVDLHKLVKMAFIDGNIPSTILKSDKQDDFNFKIINFPNMCSNILASPAYGVYISTFLLKPIFIHFHYVKMHRL